MTLRLTFRRARAKGCITLFDISPLTISVDEFSFDQSQLIFPNPSYDFISFNKSLPTKIAFEIKNVLGSNVRKGQIGGENPRIDIENLTPSIYYLILYGEKYTDVFKFIKE